MAVTTDWITSTFTYTPTSTANWTYSRPNWSGMEPKPYSLEILFTNCSAGPQGHQGRQGATGPGGSTGPLDLKDIKAAKVPQVPVVQQVPLVLKDIKVVKVPQVLAVQYNHQLTHHRQVPLVLVEPQVPLVLKDIKVSRCHWIYRWNWSGTSRSPRCSWIYRCHRPQGVQGASSSSSTSVSPPGSPSDGDLWYDSENGNLYVYYNDGSSSQWVATTHTGPEGPTGPTGLTGPQGVQGASGPSTNISSNVTPSANNTYDIGTSSLRWRNVYTNDLNLSNKGSTNEVDGSWGEWTIQEGEDDLFLINRRNGRKYTFMLRRSTNHGH